MTTIMNVRRLLFCTCFCLCATSCYQYGMKDERDTGTEKEVRLVFREDGAQTRVQSPDEELLTDINLFIFNEAGILEEKMYLPSSGLYMHDGAWCRDMKLHTFGKYDIYAIANAGYELLPSWADLEQVRKLRVHLSRPDDFSSGIPMSAHVKGASPSRDGEITVPLVRLVARLSLRIDRGGLDEDVSIDVRSVKVGACPRSVAAFEDNTVSSRDDIFASGYTLGSLETDPLNFNEKGDISYPVNLYLLENRGTNESSTDNEYRSYIEIAACYSSKSHHTEAGKYVRYRFRIGNGDGNCDVRRNCHYRVCAVFDGDGLGDGTEGNWRVDATDLSESETWFKAWPSSFIKCHVGDTVHLWCRYSPSSAPFDIGMEELEDEKARGICDYEIDDDGLGARLFAKKTGSALYYFSAGEPVNDAAMFMVVVDP